MTPKTIKYVDQERQDNFSCKHENTWKSTEFSEGDEQLCLLTVAMANGPLRKLCHTCPWGQIWPRPGGSIVSIDLLWEKN